MTMKRWPAGKRLWLACGTFFIINLLVLWMQSGLRRAREENLLLQSSMNTSGQVKYDWSVGGALGSYLPHIPDAQQVRLVTLVGMSQMYAINDRKAGDATISEHLDNFLSPHKVRAFGVAAPNLSNEEALFLFETLASAPATKPAVFIYGLCFDKFRNVDLRPEYQMLLRDLPKVAEKWRKHGMDGSAQFPRAGRKMMATLAAARTKQSVGAGGRLEERLRDFAAHAMPIVSSRKEVSSFLQLQLFLGRNWLFNVKPTSKRPVIASRYELNWEFLKLLSMRAREENVHLVLYVIPLNPQAENPYITTQYELFKRNLALFCNQEGIPFANFENVVPSQCWGEFMGGADFKHFRGEGHHMTAEAIMFTFRPVLLGD